MPYTVAVSFDKFFENINLPGDHRETANARRDNIVSSLEKEFEILDAFPTGSIPRFTAVKGYADLDVLVVLHYGKHIQGKKPSEVLQAVRDVLAEYRTNIRRNGQAVTLYYKTWPNVDVVPVSRITNTDGTIAYYNVPDMNRETWIPSRPRRHSNDLAERSKTFGSEFKHIIKMIKWWNQMHSALLESYHLEVLSLRILNGSFDDYPWKLYYYFDKAYDITTTSLWDGGDQVDEYLDWKTRQEVLKRLTTARDKARDAWYATYGNNDAHEKAIGLWRQIFGDKFPAYG